MCGVFDHEVIYSVLFVRRSVAHRFPRIFSQYPNPYASHVVSCDVISRMHTPSGTLLTTRLILKRGALPWWAPQGIVSRAESWVIEESEVDPAGRIITCRTKNLDHIKVMQVEESVALRQTSEGKTLQTTEARIISRFGWGLTRRIESHGLARFKANVQRSREGISLILELIRRNRPETLGLGGGNTENGRAVDNVDKPVSNGSWTRLTSWFRTR